MKITYDEMLRKMKTAFFNENITNADDCSDLGLRINAVASELYALYCYGDYVLKQSFPQSANGSYLDMHGKMRGIERKTQSKALGYLTFYLAEAQQDDVYVPVRTICSRADMPYIQFATTNEGVIKAGETSVTIPADAGTFGSAYNAKVGTVNVMVNPPSSISRVTNNSEFSGGCDAENDDDYRNRILNSFSVPLNGFNSQSLVLPIMKLDFVTDCNIVSTNDAIVAFVKTRSNSLSDSEKASIVSATGINTLLKKEVSASLATPKTVDVLIELVSNANSDDIKSEIANIVQSSFTKKIGETVYSDIIERKISNIEDVQKVSIYFNGKKMPVLTSNSSEYFDINKVEVCFVDQL